MVAAGVPTPWEDHAQVLARFALAARDPMAAYNRTSRAHLALRLGINSGPMVAGVIGRRRFSYDQWGDAVNTASRMEPHGPPGRIQISDATRELLGEAFVCTERGAIEAKSKGPTRTWFLERERTVPTDPGLTDVPVGLADVTAIAAGQTHSLALRADGTVVAWGSNISGETDIPVRGARVLASASAPRDRPRDIRDRGAA